MKDMLRAKEINTNCLEQVSGGADTELKEEYWISVCGLGLDGPYHSKPDVYHAVSGMMKEVKITGPGIYNLIIFKRMPDGSICKVCGPDME